MPHEGQQILNPRTGQQMTFVELRGELLRINSVNPPTTEREPVHVHPRQESGAEVLSGSLVLEVAGQQRRLSAGETISVPANTPHRFWNDGNEEAHSIQFFRERDTSCQSSWPLLRALTAVLAPLARLRGYRGRVEI